MRYLYSPKNERIYDPQAGTGISTTDAVAKYKNNPNIFISFTEIEKIGINPHSEYETPIGIYCYPLKEFWKLYKPDNTKPFGKFAPFAGKNKWVNVLKRNRYGREFIQDVGNNSRYTEKDYRNDLFWIVKNKGTWIYNMYKSYVDYPDNRHPYSDFVLKYAALSKTGMKPSEIMKEILKNGDMEKSIEGFLDFSYGRGYNSFGAKLWNITRELVNRKPVAWTKLFLDMGIVGVADRSGNGIIHPNEPMQAVFFTTRAFDLVERIENNVKPRTTEIKLSPQDIKRYRDKYFTPYAKYRLKIINTVSPTLYSAVHDIVHDFGEVVAFRSMLEPPSEFILYMIGEESHEDNLRLRNIIRSDLQDSLSFKDRSLWNSIVRSTKEADWNKIGPRDSWILH